MRFRRRRAPAAKYIVQLHRVKNHPTIEHGCVVLSSWAPIETASLDEAQRFAQRLRIDNRWGGPAEYPHVTITGPDGENVWERGVTPPVLRTQEIPAQPEG